ncbi:MAG TPA: N-acetylmuramoyl-L-alanine amidase [Vicinamibacterales bacterium]
MKSPALLVLLAVVALAATPPVRTMYNDALVREQAVRTSLTANDAGPNVLKDARAVVARYEAVVRKYPASSYSDNALWQAAHLAFDVFDKFGDSQDRDTGMRLLKQLSTMFPTSKLASKVPDEIARLTEPPIPRIDEPPAPKATDAPKLTLPPPPPPEKLPASAPVAVGQPPRTTDRPAERAPERTAERQAERTPERTATATIKSIKRSVLPDAVRVVIELDGEVDFHQERIENPSRVFVDLSSTHAASTLIDRTLRFESDADVVRQVRIGRHPNNVTRVVLDANGVSSYSVYPLYAPYRLVIDCVRTTVPSATTGQIDATSFAPNAGTLAHALKPTAPPIEMPKPQPVPAKPVPVRREAPLLAGHAPTSVWLRAAPGNVSQHSLILAEIRTPAPVPVPIKTITASEKPVPAPEKSADATPAAPAAKNGSGGFSIARQLGLGVSRIVIDAGHGGHDPGAQGKGVSESELVLDVALRVEKLLQKTPGVEVILTRRTDDFIALQERTALANREGADLFLSIHANASNSAQAHGIETYFLNFASNLSAAAVAARENAASGQAMSELPDIVKAIALNNKLDESRDFATQIQQSMLDHLRGSNKTLKDLGVKQAPFVVLIGAAMPSVLAEISFVTNPQEARLLKSNAYRQKIAEALYAAIRKYQTSLKSITTVASPPPLQR